MSNRPKDREPADPFLKDPSRREFVAFTAIAGFAAYGGAAAAAEADVVAKDVAITTPDGNCDAAFFHPATGKHPGVLIWTDAFGLRPTFRDLGKRLAAHGYAVLVPNPFYRMAKAPVYTEAEVSSFDFQDAAQMAKVKQFMASPTAPGAAEADAKAFTAFLDAQTQVNPARKLGTQGYCMGGALVMRTAATVADRIGAGASFHGGGLVTDKPDSPHLLAPKIKARLYIAIASNDDQRQPEAKDKLRQAFAAARVAADIEVYAGARHGWCVADMPLQNGQPIYSKADAERAWSKLLGLYETALAS
jgi:carboxymethylenebutenolidase